MGTRTEMLRFFGVPVEMNSSESGSHERPLISEPEVAPQSMKNPRDFVNFSEN